MIPNPDQLQAIAKLRSGDLAEIPFAVLLHALAACQKSVVLEVERRPLKKEIIIEKGVPVDCRSNVLSDTLGRFMVAQGIITQEQEQRCLAKTVAQGLQMGEVLILENLITASELFKTLQQSLAKKLLDGFTWHSGEFRVHEQLPEVVSPLKVNVAQLVLTGVSKFAPDEEVNAAFGPLVGKKLYLHPEPPYPLGELRLSAQQQELVALMAGGKRVDELAAETKIPFDQIMRLLYPLAIIGTVVPEDWMPEERRGIASQAEVGSTAASASAGAEVVDPAAKRDELMEVYLNYRKQDAFDLLGLPENASLVEIQQRYLEFSRKFAPWSFTTPQLENLAEKAEDLFLAGGMAFGELCDGERRNALIVRRRTLREEREKRPAAGRFAIKSQLLDPEVQFKKGKALMQAGKHREARQQLQFAFDFDPQNSVYRAELAYCRFLDDPVGEVGDSLSELKETMRIDPRCGLAFYYAGEIHRRLGKAREAEEYLRPAVKMMMPDRRPVEALKALETGKKGHHK